MFTTILEMPGEIAYDVDGGSRRAAAGNTQTDLIWSAKKLENEIHVICWKHLDRSQPSKLHFKAQHLRSHSPAASKSP